MVEGLTVVERPGAYPRYRSRKQMILLEMQNGTIDLEEMYIRYWKSGVSEEVDWLLNA
jgi:hypothetical protein